MMIWSPVTDSLGSKVHPVSTVCILVCTVQGWAAQKTTNLRQNKLRKMLPTAWINYVTTVGPFPEVLEVDEVKK